MAKRAFCFFLFLLFLHLVFHSINSIPFHFFWSIDWHATAYNIKQIYFLFQSVKFSNEHTHTHTRATKPNAMRAWPGCRIKIFYLKNKQRRFVSSETSEQHRKKKSISYWARSETKDEICQWNSVASFSLCHNYWCLKFKQQHQQQNNDFFSMNT